MCNQDVSVLLSSEGVGIVTGEPFTVNTAILAHDADHLVHVGAHLHAARQADEARVAILASDQPLLLDIRFLVQLVEPGVGDVHGALSTVDASRVEIKRNLMRAHLVLLITAATIGPDAWGTMTLKHLEKTLTSCGCQATRDTIGRHAVDPNDVVCHLNSSIGSGRSHGVTTAKHARECT